MKYFMLISHTRFNCYHAGRGLYNSTTTLDIVSYYHRSCTLLYHRALCMRVRASNRYKAKWKHVISKSVQ